MLKWKPMQSAPKDGTRVILFDPNNLQPVTSGCWKGAYWIGGPYDGSSVHPVGWLPYNRHVENPAEEPSFFIGQRVFVGQEIGTVVISETGRTRGVWVHLPSRGYASDYALTSVKCLPNGQL